ncbi:unnamed protein product [Oppiella nova]|uniref:Uncharacterized protein n=1 Tax=Oppiella nova TaxID=334625 RepID=A0A7R9QZT4_9ACAR|nr:unnamed protein product [Oppiella nova]CAG2181766.1 unnamed protein product [Oppiella nova]
MAFVWLQWVLIVSSLASIAISSEVATNETAETAVVPQWAAPQPDERELRGVGAMDPGNYTICLLDIPSHLVL